MSIAVLRHENGQEYHVETPDISAEFDEQQLGHVVGEHTGLPGEQGAVEPADASDWDTDDAPEDVAGNSAQMQLAGVRHRKSGPPPPRIQDPTPNRTPTSQWAKEPWNAAQEAKDLLPDTLSVIKDLKLDNRIWQGIGDDPDSWGTHYADGTRVDPATGKLGPYGAAVDIDMTGVPYAERVAYVRSLRKNGMAAWLRYATDGQKRDSHGNVVPGTGFANDHIHLVDPIAPNLVNPDIRLDKNHQVNQFYKGLLGTAYSRDYPSVGADKRVPITQWEIGQVRQRYAHGHQRHK